MVITLLMELVAQLNNGIMVSFVKIVNILVEPFPELESSSVSDVMPDMLLSQLTNQKEMDIVLKMKIPCMLLAKRITLYKEELVSRKVSLECQFTNPSVTIISVCAHPYLPNSHFQ